MKLAFTSSFKRDYQELPKNIQEQADAQIERMLSNPRHPSLRIKKMEGHRSIWEARISTSYRMTFQIVKDTYLLRRVGTHDILKQP